MGELHPDACFYLAVAAHSSWLIASHLANLQGGRGVTLSCMQEGARSRRSGSFSSIYHISFEEGLHVVFSYLSCTLHLRQTVSAST